MLESEALAAARVDDANAHWTFDEGSGATVLDSSSNNHMGTIVGAGYVAGRFSGALSFNGADHYVFSIYSQSGGSTGGGLDVGTRDWTISAWVKLPLREWS
jgi:hypothetical protein